MRDGLLLWTRLVLLVGGGAARPELLVGGGAARHELVFRVPEVLVRAAAVPRPVGTGPAARATHSALTSTRGNHSALTSTRGNHSALTASDYVVEHEVPPAAARRAAQLLDLSDVAVWSPPPGCGGCARWERDYCLGDGLLADHCCCERRFLPEPLPWVPHACLLPASRCRPLAASCAHYARLRDCCCLRDMAEKWKSILAGAAGLRGGGAAFALAVMLALRAAL